MATKIKIRSAYSEKEPIFTPTGDGYTQEYSYKLNAKGQKELVPDGKTNTLEFIQQFKEEVSIDNILAKVAVGDYSDFRPDGIYQDTTKIPNNLNEARAVMMELENYWNTLSNEVKAKFDFSLEEFISKAGSEAWGINAGLISENVPEGGANEPEQKTSETAAASHEAAGNTESTNQKE